MSGKFVFDREGKFVTEIWHCAPASISSSDLGGTSQASVGRNRSTIAATGVCRDQAPIQDEDAIALYSDAAISLQPVQNARHGLPSCANRYCQRVVRHPKFVFASTIGELQKDARQARFGLVKGKTRCHLHAMGDELVLTFVKAVAECRQLSTAAKEV